LILKTFEELGVCEGIRRAIEEMGFVQPMPVQEEVIPYLLGNEFTTPNTDQGPVNDVIALAQTGTGKTAAFGIPVLQRIADMPHPQMGEIGRGLPLALVLAPTRELCLQIADDMRDFGKYLDGIHIEAVYGGASIEQQIRALRKGVQIIVATPGRLIDLMKRGVAKLDDVYNVVLDEADEMLNMGFSESIDAILEGIPEEHNTLLFSATMSREIERIAKGYLRDYQEIVVGSRNEGAEHVNHIYYMVNAKDKYLALKRLVDYNPRIFAIIFCRTKIETQEVADKLIRDGYNAEALHGDLSQQQRDLTMQKFRQHTVQLLVATDVAARGLDVDDLTHVINYGLPDDIENYTHRSGRTGRAGKKGTSISIVHSREKHKIRNIEKEIGKQFEQGTIPSAEEICKKQLYKVMDQIVKADVDEEQIAPFMQDISRYFEYIDKEDLIKKIVSLEFGKFLAYYADAPEIETVTSRKDERGKRNEHKTVSQAIRPRPLRVIPNYSST
jgi:ATP-dependent RNA helicase DeaD